MHIGKETHEKSELQGLEPKKQKTATNDAVKELQIEVEKKRLDIAGIKLDFERERLFMFSPSSHLKLISTAYPEACLLGPNAMIKQPILITVTGHIWRRYRRRNKKFVINLHLNEFPPDLSRDQICK